MVAFQLNPTSLRFLFKYYNTQNNIVKLLHSAFIPDKLFVILRNKDPLPPNTHKLSSPQPGIRPFLSTLNQVQTTHTTFLKILFYYIPKCILVCNGPFPLAIPTKMLHAFLSLPCPNHVCNFPICNFL